MTIVMSANPTESMKPGLPYRSLPLSFPFLVPVVANRQPLEPPFLNSKKPVCLYRGGGLFACVEMKGDRQEMGKNAYL